MVLIKVKTRVVSYFWTGSGESWGNFCVCLGWEGGGGAPLRNTVNDKGVGGRSWRVRDGGRGTGREGTYMEVSDRWSGKEQERRWFLIYCSMCT